MGFDSKSKRFRRLQRLADGPFPATTILYARDFLSRYPDHAFAWVTLGIELVGVARYDEAELIFAHALGLCPASKRHFVYGELGHLSRAAGDYDQAATWYRKGIAAAPHQAGNHIYLGAVLEKKGELAEAEAAHRAATVCTEGCIEEAYLNLGFVLRAQERFKEAADSLRSAIDLDPDYPEARRALRDVERAIISQRRDS